LGVVEFSEVQKEAKCGGREIVPAWAAPELRNASADEWDDDPLRRGDSKPLGDDRQKRYFLLGQFLL